MSVIAARSKWQPRQRGEGRKRIKLESRSDGDVRTWYENSMTLTSLSLVGDALLALLA